ncbi:dienelactone hydrolase family protein [Qipengyuania thermophila]|uniref:dienelactone hydrolase family protein n=1 Tax=Qipengyuania thermophila TaxID=2509361 RepID=UPI001F23C1B3|nr:dienelactone hydrolase family protein [Qipengyuania thermophila]
MLRRWAHEELSRRTFGMAGVAGAAGLLAACAAAGPAGAGATAAASGTVRGGRVNVPLAEGTNDAYFTALRTGRHPAVILWPDIASLRPVFTQMADRLAGHGFAVLVLNPYYRDTPAPVFADFAAFVAQGGFQRVGPWRSRLTAETIGADTRAAVAWLDAQPQVDTARGIGTQGYCMGGPFTFWSAAAIPQRVRAAASFHGGGLVTDNPGSPHTTFGATRAHYLVAISQDDDAKAPTHKTILSEAAAAAGRPAVVEVYPADHGWTVPDSPVYDRTQAERAWEALLALYARAL